MTKESEAEIESCFTCEVEFYYPKDLESLNDLLDEFKKRSRLDETENELTKNVNNIFGEKTTRNRFLVKDDFFCLADGSKKFASFLTVACKYRCSCVYMFPLIFPEKTTWRWILSQTNIYNIFPATVPLPSVRRILESACFRKTTKYIPRSALWINRLFIELANRDKICLTIDCSGINKDHPGRF